MDLGITITDDFDTLTSRPWGTIVWTSALTVDCTAKVASSKSRREQYNVMSSANINRVVPWADATEGRGETARLNKSGPRMVP